MLHTLIGLDHRMAWIVTYGCVILPLGAAAISGIAHWARVH